MILQVEKSEKLHGSIAIPSSKSHTIRAIIIASLADDQSEIRDPLFSEDTKAAINGCRALGAQIELQKKEEQESILSITGFSGQPKKPKQAIHTLNSGTTTNLLTSVASLGDFRTIIDGDESIRKRPVQPLIDALNNLGAKVKSINHNGCPPLEINGILKGGSTDILCKSSQYVSSLLISCPLAEEDSSIQVKNVCEEPYIEMTLRWLKEQKIDFESEGYSHFDIKGGQSYQSFTKAIPADWSTAAFPICAAAATSSAVTVEGLDNEDSQGDKAVIDYLKEMNANIKINANSSIEISPSELEGAELDLNKTPDALPVMAVIGCIAKGETIIRNVAHARIKETDRIKVMTQELLKMGAKIKELPDGLVIKHSKLKGAMLNGHNDHRVVMALSIAGMVAHGKTKIDTAEAISVTYPSYVESMKKLGANLQIVNE